MFQRNVDSNLEKAQTSNLDIVTPRWPKIEGGRLQKRRKNLKEIKLKKKMDPPTKKCWAPAVKFFFDSKKKEEEKNVIPSLSSFLWSRNSVSPVCRIFIIASFSTRRVCYQCVFFWCYVIPAIIQGLVGSRILNVF